MTDGVTRREFVLTSGMGLASASLASSAQSAGDTKPWYTQVKRCGQTNMNEKDLLGVDVEAWADYWASLKLDAVLLNGGGIVAYYPTRIPYHHRSKFLTDRDVLGEFITAVKKRGIRVMARMDPNFAYEDALQARPEWFQRTAGGQPLHDPESTWLFRTCMFSTYFTEQFVAILREISSLYDIDGFFTNGWPSTGAPRLCYCENCRRVYRDKVGGIPQKTLPSDLAYRKFFDVHMDRIQEIWRLWDKTAKEKRWDRVFAGNLHTNIRAVKNLKKLAEVASWFNIDGQDRGGDDHPLWYCAQQGRVAQSVMMGRTLTNSLGAYASTNYTIWRHTSKSPEEAILWLAETAAAGMAPKYHWLGGSPVDNRWRETGRKFYQWMARHDRHFRNKRSLADIAILYSQSTLTRYGAGRPERDRAAPSDSFQGIYYALLEGRFLFDFVHEDKLDAESLEQYKTLILPNVAYLSDHQCEQLRAFVRRGGSLLATFETSLYNEWGDPRPEFGLGDVLGVKRASETQGPLRNSYARVENPEHQILNGIGPTEILPGAVYRVPVRLIQPGPLVLSYIPPYPSHPPEMVYPRIERTDEPAVVLTSKGASRIAYFPGDVDRSCWRTSNTDLDLLLQNTIRWVRGDTAMESSAPVQVDGEGVMELFAWETEPGYAIHLVNYTNPHMLAGWVRRFYPAGRQEITVKIPEHVKISAAQALRFERKLPFRREGELIRFEIPLVVDYEVVALVRG
jgi:hypothetical protein